MKYIDQIFGDRNYSWSVKTVETTSNGVVVVGTLAVKDAVREGVGFARQTGSSDPYTAASELAFKQACEMFGAGNAFGEE